MKDGLILGDEIAGVNQILPHKHKQVWDLFQKGVANNWSPSEINMSDDINQWKGDALTKDEKLLVKRCLGFFAGSESLVGNKLLLTVARWVTDPECRQYILRQAYEESLHNWTVVTCCESYSLKISEVYEAYLNVPSIKAKDDFLMENYPKTLKIDTQLRLITTSSCSLMLPQRNKSGSTWVNPLIYSIIKHHLNI